MGCFAIKEDTEAYKFALYSYGKFGFQQPLTVMTDQDKALTSAISQNWADSKHLFCVFHIYRNIKKNVGAYLGRKNTKFLKDFTIVLRTEDKEEFKSRWKDLIIKYCENNENENNSSNNYNDENADNIESSSEEEEQIQSSTTRNRKQIKDNKKQLKNYLKTLYDTRKSWAKCYTFLNFAAGLFF